MRRTRDATDDEELEGRASDLVAELIVNGHRVVSHEVDQVAHLVSAAIVGVATVSTATVRVARVRQGKYSPCGPSVHQVAYLVRAVAAVNDLARDDLGLLG